MSDSSAMEIAWTIPAAFSRRFSDPEKLIEELARLLRKDKIIVEKQVCPHGVGNHLGDLYIRFGSGRLSAILCFRKDKFCIFGPEWERVSEKLRSLRFESGDPALASSRTVSGVAWPNRKPSQKRRTAAQILKGM